MRSTDRQPGAGLLSARALMFVVPLFLSGCTAEDNQSLLDAVASAIVQAASELVGFAASFARQILAAYLF